MKNNQRVHAIDGIRGFSLFGILLANMLIFQYGITGKDYIGFFDMSTIDKGMYHLIKILVEDSFLPIFTFLFGYALVMMRNSLERKQKRIKWHLSRRSLGLLGLGLLHATFLWEGDILTLYGIMGILLLVFVNRKPKTILIWGLLLFSLLILSSVGDIGEDDALSVDEADVATYIDETNYIYGTGTYAEINTHRNEVEPPMFAKLEDKKLGLIFLLLPFFIAPMFLFGMYAAKKEFFFHPEKERKYYFIGSILFLPLGILLKTLGHFYGWEAIISVGGPLLAVGYIACLGLFYSNIRNTRFLKPFESIGKLSLTNYIGQTVICTTIFYGYGLGLFNMYGVTWGVLLSIVIFAAQFLVSTWYLKHFRYGPLERLLRIWTNLSFSNKNSGSGNKRSLKKAN